MGRHPQPEIAPRLLDACTDHALAHGLPDRLGPFAAAAGVSGRMLIYHFGTKEALQRAVLHRARERQVAVFGELLRVRPDEPYPATLARAWAGMTGPAGQPYLRMFGWLRQHGHRELWPEFPLIATTDWLGPLEAGLRTLGRPELATLVLAVIRGLLMDLDATGDVARTGAAMTHFLDSIREVPLTTR